MNINFQQEKKTFLKKKDKSKKGAIDKEIKSLVDLINSKKNYYTTSSCAGRIVLFKEPKPWIKPKIKFLFAAHNRITKEDIEDIKRIKSKGTVWLKQEGMILHVCCATIEHANKLLNIARKYFKRSGIIAYNKKIVVEITSTEKMDVPVMEKGRFLITDIYLNFLIKKANEKLEKNKKRIAKFHNEIKKEL